jgi:hypothetical protein
MREQCVNDGDMPWWAYLIPGSYHFPGFGVGAYSILNKVQTFRPSGPGNGGPGYPIADAAPNYFTPFNAANLQTFMKGGTVNGAVAIQTNPTVDSCIPAITQSAHPGVMVVGMGDASCRMVSGGISVTTWVRACIPNDGQVLGSDW